MSDESHERYRLRGQVHAALAEAQMKRKVIVISAMVVLTPVVIVTALAIAGLAFIADELGGRA